MTKKSSKSPSVQGAHILLVEDNMIALRIAETLVKQAGCSCVSVMDGEEALKWLESTSFDMIITDIGLPGISGNELTQRIRQEELRQKKKPVPIIGLTAHLLGDAETESLAVGMNRVLVKPVYLETIQQLVNDYFKPAALTEPASQLMLDDNLTEEEKKLFVLDNFSLLDIEQGIKNLTDIKVFKELLSIMITQAIPEDKAAIESAYAEKNWTQIQNIAHKMKSGALYCGTVRMQYACQYFERYVKTGEIKLREQLFQQLMQVVDETRAYVETWLANPEQLICFSGNEG